MDIKEELRKYKEMLDEGLITQDDFEKLKNKLLELETSSVKTEEDDPFKSFKEKNSAASAENATQNEAPKDNKKAEIDTSWLHEEYLIPPTSGNNSTSYGSNNQNSTIGSKDTSIHVDDKPAKKKINGFCIAAGALGAVSALIINPFCIIAILGLIFSIIGLVDCRKKRQHGDIYAIIGLIFSIVGAVLFFVSLFSALGMGNNPVAKYLNSKDYQELGTLENKMLSSYNSVTGDNYVSDNQTLLELREHTIVYARELNNKALEIAQNINDEELLEVHRIYVNYSNYFLQAIGQSIEAIKNQDYSLLSEANNVLSEANNYALDFSSEIKKLAEKYNGSMPNLLNK